MLRLIISIILSCVVCTAPGQRTDTYTSQRLNMVQTQITQRGIVHRATIKSMEKVPRHQFVPSSYTRYAYEDRPLPIGYGQTISQPYIVAYMTELLKPTADMTALEIGTGSGYQAAVLAEIVNHIYTIEIVPQLGQTAEKTLRKLGYENVTLKIADGYHGWKEKGPFDIIVVTAAADHIPPPLIDQLKEGGRMIIPVGSPFLIQQLMLVEKMGGKVKTRSLISVRFVPFTRAE